MSKYPPFIPAGSGPKITASSLLFGGVGSASIVVGAAYLIKGTSSAAEILHVSADLDFTGLASFRDAADVDCVKKYFGKGIDFKSLGTAVGQGPNIEENHFSGDGHSSGCLVINWERTDAANGGRWRGEFKWLWTLQKGDRGMVMAGFLSPSAADNRMSLESGIYFLEQEVSGESRRWSIRGHRELSSTDVDKDGFDVHFPKAGTAIKGTLNPQEENKKDHWGFSAGSSDLANICKLNQTDGGCPSDAAAAKKFKGSWLWVPKPEGAETIDKWSSNLASNLKTIYGSTGFGLEVSSFGAIKGSWSRETPEGPK